MLSLYVASCTQFFMQGFPGRINRERNYVKPDVSLFHGAACEAISIPFIRRHGNVTETRSRQAVDRGCGDKQVASPVGV